MKNKFFILILFVGVYFFPVVSSVHWITGYVNDAFDGEGANNQVVVLWNPMNGEEDNLTDVIGSGGNSYTSNVYLIDCELLNVPCQIGDNLSVKVIDSGEGGGSFTKNVTVTGAGYDTSPELRINSLPFFQWVNVDDDFHLILNRIDLVSNSTREVKCTSAVREYDGESLNSPRAEFYHTSFSFLGDNDDNNFHYTNNSCFINESYGDENESFVECSFLVQYYANPGSWECSLSVNDSFYGSSGVDDTIVNPLISIGISDNVSFEGADSGEVSLESEIKIFNTGNTLVDLNIYGYGENVGDGLSMTCSQGEIPIYFKKYNLLSSIFGSLTLMEFENNYENLTGSSVFRDFNLAARENDFFDDAYKPTYWRVYVPEGVSGTCRGNIEIGAVMST